MKSEEENSLKHDENVNADVNADANADANEMLNNNDEEYLSKVSKIKGIRVFAWIALIAIFGLLIATIYHAIIGSEHFIKFLFLTIMVSVLCYVFLWLGKVLTSSSNK